MPNTHSYLVGLCLLLAACAAPQEIERSRSGVPDGLRYASAVDEVRTIQLFAGQEAALPVLSMQRGVPLTLAFDLLGREARPLSVYFYHANRRWQRDLTRGEFHTSFHRDDLFDYTLSGPTEIGYVHYRYVFPNGSIGFRISGNYLLRVTELGDEEAVLFERPFYVAEDVGPIILDLRNLLTGRQVLPAVQPFLRFTPPPEYTGSVFDYSVCFIRNGQHAVSRCSHQPSLSSQPELQFFLQPEDAFLPQEGDYYLDLRRLLPGGPIERISFVSSPFDVVLHADYARFPSTGAAPQLGGQSVVFRAITGGGDPATHGEYANVVFSYVPPEEARLSGGVYVAGSFNGWRVDLGHELRWQTDQRRYTGSFLIKQGEYTYRYTSPDPAVRAVLHARMPRADNQYTALIYFRDITLGTDRLLGYQHAYSR